MLLSSPDKADITQIFNSTKIQLSAYLANITSNSFDSIIGLYSYISLSELKFRALVMKLFLEVVLNLRRYQELSKISGHAGRLSSLFFLLFLSTHVHIPAYKMRFLQ